MSTKDNDPAQDPKQASLLNGDSSAPAAEASQPVAQTAAQTGGEAAAAPASDADTAAKAMPAQGGHGSEGSQSSDGSQISEVAADQGAAPAAEPELTGQLPGELLAARRIEMRLTIDELAARVKLAPRQLIALEANDFGALPGMATTRGFIRSCAKTMGMDPEPLLALLAQEPNPALAPMVMRRPLPQPGFNGRRYAPSTSHRRSANKLSGLAAVVLIFVGMLSYIAWRNDWLHLPSLDFSSTREAVSSSTGAAQEAQPPAAEAAATAEAPTPAAAAPAAPAATAATAATAAAAPSAPAASKAPAAPADSEAYAPAAPAPVAPATGPAATAKAEPAKAAAATRAIDPSRALELKLREDSWVEVLTQNGERKLVSRLIKAGSTERIEVTEPVTLVVGNAAGVDVTLRGQPVSLKAGTRDNVAKVNLK